MQSWLKILFWYPLTLALFFGAVLMYGAYSGQTRSGAVVRQERGSKTRPIAFAALPRVSFEIKSAYGMEDARPLLINKYLKSYNSPMAGLGEYIVKTADHFDVDPYLVVAIAQQESNLGKLMPPNCHNAWGWGIHSAGTLCFDSWNEGINTFISGLAENYLAYGLKTPEQIMTKYNATSPGGAWAKGVSQFLDELQHGEW